MVRFGKYSPNNPEYLGSGVLGLGEYEEKKKHFDEQRKSEYQAYLTQQSRIPPVGRKEQKTSNTVIKEKRNVLESRRHADPISKHVSTQTESNGKDASTNTDWNEEFRKTERLTRSRTFKEDSDILIAQNSSPKPRNITNREAKICNGKINSPRDFFLKTPPISARCGLLNNITNQDSLGTLDLESRPSTSRRRWRDNAALYGKELKAQVEERQRLRREMVEREKQEELARDRWMIVEGEKALSKQKEEEEKVKAREDQQIRRMEEFFLRQKELKKEAEERRHAEIRHRILQSQTATSGIIADMGRGKHSTEELGISQPVQEQAGSPLRNQLTMVHEADSFKTHSPLMKISNVRSNGTQMGEVSHSTPFKKASTNQPPSKPSSAKDYQSTKTRCSLGQPNSVRDLENSLPSKKKFSLTSLVDSTRKDETVIQGIEEKLTHDRSAFASLGEIRKQLKMDQIRMEEAIKSHKREVSSESDSPN